MRNHYAHSMSTQVWRMELSYCLIGSLLILHLRRIRVRTGGQTRKSAYKCGGGWELCKYTVFWCWIIGADVGRLLSHRKAYSRQRKPILHWLQPPRQFSRETRKRHKRPVCMWYVCYSNNWVKWLIPLSRCLVIWGFDGTAKAIVWLMPNWRSSASPCTRPSMCVSPQGNHTWTVIRTVQKSCLPSREWCMGQFSASHHT